MGECKLCGEEGNHISAFLRLCPNCARKPEARSIADDAHVRSLGRFGFHVPVGSHARCTQCANTCRLDEGEPGRCGVRMDREGKVQSVVGDDALVDWYYDPLPTNCVAEWTCGSANLCADKSKNLAVFFHGCSFDCLFCQNWLHKEGVRDLRPRRSVSQLVRSVDEKTYCVCFFGGDPTPQMQYALRACDVWHEHGVPVKVCWETNGSMSPALADSMAECSSRTGGTVKFDLKAFDEELHKSLCGITNEQTLGNFARLARRLGRNRSALLVASTLLVPGYIDAREVGSIARFIAGIDSDIPYSLLGFHPDYLMDDLPTTSLSEAKNAESAALEEGLTNVHVGNIHLLL